MAFPPNTIAKTNDPRLMRSKKWLASLNPTGRNIPKQTDTFRRTLTKILKTLKGIA